MSTDNALEEQLEKLTLELRRGILVLATLSQLHEARYGYALIQELGVRGLEIDQGTLYPLLRRLEEQGLLVSEWDTEGSRPRRYYRLSPLGAHLLKRLSQEWFDLVNTMNGLFAPTSQENDDGSY
jgi:DNA-binding PadR family transcriptional regulator